MIELNEIKIQLARSLTHSMRAVSGHIKGYNCAFKILAFKIQPISRE